MKIIDGKITEFQYPDGWYMRIGQVYSSPWEPNHFLVTRFEQDVDTGVENILVYYKEVDPNNYKDIVIDQEKYCRAWYINEGNWDLEQEGRVTFGNGNEIILVPSTYGARGKQSEYVWGLDLAKE
jgi:hypothetical protein